MRFAKTLTLVAIFLALQANSVVAQPALAPQRIPAKVEGDKSQANLVAELRGYIAATREQWSVPGLSVAIIRDGQVVMSEGFGVKETGAEEPVDADTLFAIASNSKAFTAAALAILVDEGKVKWDDHVRDYLPWLGLKDPLATADLRVRDLLCHRSGLGTFSGDLLWWQTDYSPEEVLRRARHLDAAGPFRAHYGYSNLMFLAAGEVIEVASGQSWQEFVESRILRPCQMNRTITSTRHLVEQQNFATPHKTHLDSSEPIPWVNWDTMAAAGGIISSANDMAKWLQVQMAKGQLPVAGKPETDSENSKRLFTETQSAQMWHPQTLIPSSKIETGRQYRAYGLGWSIRDHHGVRLVGHGGGYDGMYSQVWMAPDEGVGVVVLTNSMTGIASTLSIGIIDTLCRDVSASELNDRSRENLESFLKGRQRFEEKILAAVKPNSALKQATRPLDDYTGAYVCPLYGKAVVEQSDTGLVLRFLPAEKLIADLTPLHGNTFKIQWRETMAWFGEGACHFVDNADGKIERIELNVPNDDMWFYELDFRKSEL